MRWDSSGVRVAGRRAVRLDLLAPCARSARPQPFFHGPKWPGLCQDSLGRAQDPKGRGRRAVAGNSVVCILLPLAGICMTGRRVLVLFVVAVLHPLAFPLFSDPAAAPDWTGRCPITQSRPRNCSSCSRRSSSSSSNSAARVSLESAAADALSCAPAGHTPARQLIDRGGPSAKPSGRPTPRMLVLRSRVGYCCLCRLDASGGRTDGPPD